MLTAKELQFIADAKKFLENESFLMWTANSLGKPIDKVTKILPKNIQGKITNALDKSMRSALSVALKTIKDADQKSFTSSLTAAAKSRLIHSSLTGLTGFTAGFFGPLSLPLELPITTTIMMRNISAIASGFNFDPRDPKIAMECLYVFSLGSRSDHDDKTASSYYSSRFALSALIKKSAEFIAVNSAKVVLENMNKGTAPLLIHFLGSIAARFEIVVTEKLLAELIPVIGAVGGAAINVAFTDYYGQAAKYHFGLLALEQQYGEELVKSTYLQTT